MTGFNNVRYNRIWLLVNIWKVSWNITKWWTNERKEHSSDLLYKGHINSGLDPWPLKFSYLETFLDFLEKI